MKAIFSGIFLFTLFSSYAQSNLKGNWYSFSSGMFKIIQYSFDSSNFTNCNKEWDLKSLPNLTTARIANIVKRNNNLYYMKHDLQDTAEIILSIFTSVNPGKSYVAATVSEEHSSFKSMADALAFIDTDTFVRPGLVFYSESEFERLRSLPDAVNITKENYTKYLNGLIDVKASFDRFESAHESEFMFFIVYFPNQARKILGDLGYNPVIDDRHLTKIDDRFRKDPALKDLMDKAFKFE